VSTRRREKTWVHLDLGGFTLPEALERGDTLSYPVADSVWSKTRRSRETPSAAQTIRGAGGEPV
jgi:hypothetical protein